eukprot:10617210-Lingulodinium_polyedra.AAC.1
MVGLWPGNGRAMVGRWPRNGGAMVGQWSVNGRAMFRGNICPYRLFRGLEHGPRSKKPSERL